MLSVIIAIDLLVAVLLLSDSALAWKKDSQNRKERNNKKSKENKVTAEKIDKIDKDTTVKDNKSSEDQKLMEEWEKYMGDFVPEDVNTFVIPQKQDVVKTLVTNRLSMRMWESSQFM